VALSLRRGRRSLEITLLEVWGGFGRAVMSAPFKVGKHAPGKKTAASAELSSEELARRVYRMHWSLSSCSLGICGATSLPDLSSVSEDLTETIIARGAHESIKRPAEDSDNAAADKSHADERNADEGNGSDNESKHESTPNSVRGSKPNSRSTSCPGSTGTSRSGSSCDEEDTSVDASEQKCAASTEGCQNAPDQVATQRVRMTHQYF